MSLMCYHHSIFHVSCEWLSVSGAFFAVVPSLPKSSNLGRSLGCFMERLFCSFSAAADLRHGSQPPVNPAKTPHKKAIQTERPPQLVGSENDHFCSACSQVARLNDEEDLCGVTWVGGLLLVVQEFCDLKRIVQCGAEKEPFCFGDFGF